MSRKHALTTAVWLLCVYLPIVAQDESPLSVRIINSIREHEPEWRLSREEPEAAPEARPEAPRPGGTLFERMSNIARGAQKAQVPEADESEAQRQKTGTRDPLDIPRFLNRQNNQ